MSNLRIKSKSPKSLVPRSYNINDPASKRHATLYNSIALKSGRTKSLSSSLFKKAKMAKSASNAKKYEEDAMWTQLRGQGLKSIKM
jgi:hypothetical protein